MEEKEELYSLTHICLHRIPICGKPRTYRSLLRIVNDADLEEQGRGRKNAKLFSIKQLEECWSNDPRNKKIESVSDDDTDDIVKIKKETLKEELNLLKEKNKIAKQENEKRDLVIKQLKTQLVSYDEAYKYLIVRKAIHSALLRRVLITDIPTTICGMQMTEARVLCEQYYNEIMQSLIETTNLWKKKYDASNSKDIEIEIESEIRRIING